MSEKLLPSNTGTNLINNDFSSVVAPKDTSSVNTVVTPSLPDVPNAVATPSDTSNVPTDTSKSPTKDPVSSSLHEHLENQPDKLPTDVKATGMAPQFAQYGSTQDSGKQSQLASEFSKGI